MFFHMVYKSGQIFLPCCHNSRVWQRRTDRILIARPRLHSMQRGKNMHAIPRINALHESVTCKDAIDRTAGETANRRRQAGPGFKTEGWSGVSVFRK